MNSGIARSDELDRCNAAPEVSVSQALVPKVAEKMPKIPVRPRT